MRFKRLILPSMILVLLFWWCSGEEEKSQQNLEEHLPAKEKIQEKPKKEDPTPQSTQKKNCDSYSEDVVTAIHEAAQKLSGTPYSQANKTDCSGMFHKLLDEIRKVCPKGNLPSIYEARSSRDIAAWYDKNGKFTIIRNPEKQSNLIRPGTVMLYGYGSMNGKYNRKELDVHQLIQQGTGINHVAVVTKVNKRNGEVISYDIFHGRNPKYPAGITSSRKSYPYKKSFPIYGNATEPWLATANLFGN